MTDDEDIARLLGTTPSRYATVAARGTEWRRHALLNAAFRRAAEAGGHHTMAIGLLRGQPVAEEGTETWGLWEQAPDLVRAEFSVGRERVIVVFRGSTWSSYWPSEGVLTNDGRPGADHGKGPGEILLHPRDLFAALTLERGALTTFIGREVHQVRATPAAVRHPRQLLALNDIGSGADEFHLLVDDALGIVLRIEARLEGDAFRVLEIKELAVDQDIPTDTFDPPGPDR